MPSGTEAAQLSFISCRACQKLTGWFALYNRYFGKLWVCWLLCSVLCPEPLAKVCWLSTLAGWAFHQTFGTRVFGVWTGMSGNKHLK